MKAKFIKNSYKHSIFRSKTATISFEKSTRFSKKLSNKKSSKKAKINKIYSS